MVKGIRTTRTLRLAAVLIAIALVAPAATVMAAGPQDGDGAQNREQKQEQTGECTQEGEMNQEQNREQKQTGDGEPSGEQNQLQHRYMFLTGDGEPNEDAMFSYQHRYQHREQVMLM